jgi:hypothetical protein
VAELGHSFIICMVIGPQSSRRCLSPGTRLTSCHSFRRCSLVRPAPPPPPHPSPSQFSTHGETRAGRHRLGSVHQQIEGVSHFPVGLTVILVRRPPPLLPHHPSPHHRSPVHIGAPHRRCSEGARMLFGGVRMCPVVTGGMICTEAKDRPRRTDRHLRSPFGHIRSSPAWHFRGKPFTTGSGEGLRRVSVPPGYGHPRPDISGENRSPVRPARQRHRSPGTPPPPPRRYGGITVSERGNL